MRRKFPDEDEVEGDSYGEAEDREGHQPDVSCDLGRVWGGQGDGGEGACGQGDGETGAGGGLQLLPRRTDPPAGAAAPPAVPQPGGVPGTGVLGCVVGLVTGTPALGRVKPLLDSAVRGLQQAGTPAGRPVVLQLDTATGLETGLLSELTWPGINRNYIPRQQNIRT